MKLTPAHNLNALTTGCKEGDIGGATPPLCTDEESSAAPLADLLERRFPLFRGCDDDRKSKSCSISSATESPMQPFPSAVCLQKVFSLKDAPAPYGRLARATRSDGVILESVLRDLERKRLAMDKIAMVSGIGLHKSGSFSLRLPALLLPGLYIIEKLIDLGLSPPTYFVYQATDSIIECNLIDRERAQACAIRMNSFLDRYITKFHPKARKHVRLAFALPNTETHRRSIKNLQRKVATLTETNKVIAKTLASLASSCARHSNNSESVHEYLAANLLYSGVNLHEWPLTEESATLPEVVICLGGVNERPFFDVLIELREARAVPLVTQLGAKSVYYPYLDDGDIDDQLNNFSVSKKMSPAIRADFEALQVVGATLLKLVSLLENLE